MRRIPVEDIEEGMVLAEEVRDDRGGMLLNVGDKLRKTYGTKLLAWGVAEISVEGEDSAPIAHNSKPANGQRLPKEVEEKILERANHRFAKVMEEPSMRKILDLSVKRLLARTARGQGPI